MQLTDLGKSNTSKTNFFSSSWVWLDGLPHPGRSPATWVQQDGGTEHPPAVRVLVCGGRRHGWYFGLNFVSSSLHQGDCWCSLAANWRWRAVAFTPPFRSSAGSGSWCLIAKSEWSRGFTEIARVLLSAFAWQLHVVLISEILMGFTVLFLWCFEKALAALLSLSCNVCQNIIQARENRDCVWTSAAWRGLLQTRFLLPMVTIWGKNYGWHILPKN